jgi:hypothetical protein
MALQPLWALATFQFLIYTQSVGLLGRGNQPVARPLPAHTEQHKQNKRTQTYMSRVRFKPTIPAFGRAKTVHALECAATVIAALPSTFNNFQKLDRTLSLATFTTRYTAAYTVGACVS